MSTETSSPFKSILHWSATWPEWQRDALRRIVEKGKLSPQDLKELEAICRAKHGLFPATSSAPTAVPFAAAHIPGGENGTAAVGLIRLLALHNVGRLPSDQELVFGPTPGLTVIYGENGAGKSGYARVIKKACRARGTPPDIKPDAFSSTTTGSAHAQIVFRVGPDPITVDWKDGMTPDARLGQIFVFDSFSARVHVGEDGPACFKPRGLDVLPELAKACDTLKGELQADINAVESQIRATLSGWNRNNSTPIAELLKTLGAKTDPETIATEAVFTNADETRLSELVAILNSDPRLRAAATNAAAQRIRTFAETANNRSSLVTDAIMQKLGEALRDADTAARAAASAAAPDLQPSDMPGSCNAVWRKLWNAAMEYSEAYAYPAKPFPVMEADAQCVLCQQPLQEAARDRFSRFHKFVADATRKQADAAQAQLLTLKQNVDLLLPISFESCPVRSDIAREAPSLLAAVDAFAKAVDDRIAHAQVCLKEGTWIVAPTLPDLTCLDLESIATSLNQRARQEEAVADPQKKHEFERERDALTDKKWLSHHKDEVIAQLSRHISAAALEACRNDCTTNTITRKVGDLEETHVNQAFRDAFKAELEGLGMKTLPVRLDAARPIPGQRRHGVRVEGVPLKANGDPIHRVEDIASEGEHRCIALAAFMAELSQASHKSALVFDDPVSSLDHARRGKVAKRLVKEAAMRQVVVFTHDIVLLCELSEAADNAAAPASYMHLCWNGDRPGHCEPGLPWDWKSYKDRLDALEKEQRRISASWSLSPNPTNVADIRLAYTHLSATLERIVQDVILNNVVGRYRDWVRVEKLGDVAGFNASECSEVLRIDKKCSGITCRHDPAAAKAAPVPDPLELLDDLNALKSLVEQIKSRRKGTEAAGQ